MTYGELSLTPRFSEGSVSSRIHKRTLSRVLPFRSQKSLARAHPNQASQLAVAILFFQDYVATFLFPLLAAHGVGDTGT